MSNEPDNLSAATIFEQVFSKSIDSQRLVIGLHEFEATKIHTQSYDHRIGHIRGSFSFLFFS